MNKSEFYNAIPVLAAAPVLLERLEGSMPRLQNGLGLMRLLQNKIDATTAQGCLLAQEIKLFEGAIREINEVLSFTKSN